VNNIIQKLKETEQSQEEILNTITYCQERIDNNDNVEHYRHVKVACEDLLRELNTINAPM
jgi:cell fate (sporulation/competence/biofilm development) regulator YlbF (YheA/YmcA/DUF963 family)